MSSDSIGEAKEELQSESSTKPPYQDRWTLRKAYEIEGANECELADRWDVSQTTIRRWRERFGIKPHGWCGTFKLEPSHGYPKYYADTERVSIHQLIVIAEGEDPHDVFGDVEMNVDHKNGMKLDNRPTNLELVDRSDHGSKDGKRQAQQYTLSDLMFVVSFMLNPARYEQAREVEASGGGD